MLVIRTVDELITHIDNRIKMVQAQDGTPRSTARLVGMEAGLEEAKVAAEALKWALSEGYMTEMAGKELLQSAVKSLDLVWIAYQLVQGAVQSRLEADKGGNRGEQDFWQKDFWQKTVSALVDFQNKCEEL